MDPDKRLPIAQALPPADPAMQHDRMSPIHSPPDGDPWIVAGQGQEDEAEGST